MKTLLTHPRPHLDDICGIWLIKKYLPGWSKAAVDFTPATTTRRDDKDTLMVGIGRGLFDEHKGDVGESATTLVWKHVREHVQDPLDAEALDRLTEWVRKGDTSEHDHAEMVAHGSWLPAEQLHASYLRHGKDSHALYAFGAELCENALLRYRNEAELERDWKKRVEFETPWGRGVGLTTDASGADDFAYSAGFVLVAYVHPRNNYRGYRATPESAVDLTATHAHLTETDPKASWFLHHSKKLLLAGSDVAPETPLSKLSLDQLIKAIR